jgi:NAD(P)-dependent dehydrogenase (short-subunit alcohol dehydrogenase family)
MTNLEGKTALVTGASRGIGAAVARPTRPRSHRILETAFRPVTEA